MTCPWDSLTPAAMQFCERELCAFIEQPANTWSNLIYVFIGAWIIRLASRAGRPDLRVIGWIEIVLGLGSMVFHATSSHLGAILDMAGMYVFVAYVLVFNLQRLLRARGGTGLSPAAANRLFLGIAIGSTAGVGVFADEVGIWVFASEAVRAGHFEVRLYRKHRDPSLDYRPIVHLLAAFAIAWTFWWLDVLKILCDPDNHILQGHAAWHILNSTCFLFLYRFQEQIAPLPDAEPAPSSPG